jgi:hypothetical protein
VGARLVAAGRLLTLYILFTYNMDSITPPVRKRGRRSLRTPATARAIAEALGRGLPLVHAAAVAGVTPQTVCSWRHNDAAFETQIQEAIARGVESRLRIIEAAAMTDWRAAAFLLQTCQPEHFSKQRVVESVSYTQNNFTIPKELLDLIATTRRQNEKLITESSGN